MPELVEEMIDAIPVEVTIKYSVDRKWHTYKQIIYIGDKIELTLDDIPVLTIRVEEPPKGGRNV